MAESGIKSAKDLAGGGQGGSNIDIDIDFDKQGQLDGVKVDGEMVPLQAQPAGDASGADGASSDGVDVSEEVDTSGITESINRLLDASIDVWNNFLEHLPYVVLAFGVFVMIIFLASACKAGARSLMLRSGMVHSLSEVLSRFIYVLVWITGSLLIAKLLFPGFEFGKAVTYLGIVSLVAGFAFRDIFENAFAGLLILWRFPFEIGDYIEVEIDPPVRGRVHDIWVRSTLIREVSDELVVVPNAKIYQNAVRVGTWKEHTRQRFGVMVSYDTDLAQARSVIIRALESCERVKDKDGIFVYIENFADSGVRFQAIWWAQSGPLEELQSRDQVAEAIRTALAEAEIEIPFPYRTLTFKGDSPLHTTTHSAAETDMSDGAEAEAEPQKSDAQHSQHGKPGSD